MEIIQPENELALIRKISPLMASILGIANFVSGVIYDHRWAKSLAYGWWAGAAAMFIFPGLHSLLVFSVLMLVLQIMPGIVFYRIWKKELGDSSFPSE